MFRNLFWRPNFSEEIFVWYFLMTVYNFSIRRGIHLYDIILSKCISVFGNEIGKFYWRPGLKKDTFYTR